MHERRRRRNQAKEKLGKFPHDDVHWKMERKMRSRERKECGEARREEETEEGKGGIKKSAVIRQ